MGWSTVYHRVHAQDTAEMGEPEKPQLQLINCENGQAPTSDSNDDSELTGEDQKLFDKLVELAETGDLLQVINGGHEQAPSDPSASDISNYPLMMQEAYQKSLCPGTRLNDEGELIDDPGVCHPRLNDKG
jgi:hypothetical protein